MHEQEMHHHFTKHAVLASLPALFHMHYQLTVLAVGDTCRTVHARMQEQRAL